MKKLVKYLILFSILFICFSVRNFTSAQNNLDSIKILIKNINYKYNSFIELSIINLSNNSFEIHYDPSIIFSVDSQNTKLDIYAIHPQNNRTILLKYNINKTLFSESNRKITVNKNSIGILDTISLDLLFDDLIATNSKIYFQLKNPIINGIKLNVTLTSNLLAKPLSTKTDLNIYSNSNLNNKLDKFTSIHNKFSNLIRNDSTGYANSRAYFISNEGILIIEYLNELNNLEDANRKNKEIKSRIILSRAGSINGVKILPGTYFISEESVGDNYKLFLYKQTLAELQNKLKVNPNHVIITDNYINKSEYFDVTHKTVDKISSLSANINLESDDKIIPILFNFNSDGINESDNILSLSIDDIQKSTIHLLKLNQDLDLALYYINQAIRKDRNNALSYRIKSLIYYKQGNKKQANKFHNIYIRKALKVESHNYFEKELKDLKSLELSALN